MSQREMITTLVLGLLFLGMFVVPAVAELQTVTLTIEGMV